MVAAMRSLYRTVVFVAALGMPQVRRDLALLSREPMLDELLAGLDRQI
jgi:hypothetical protein